MVNRRSWLRASVVLADIGDSIVELIRYRHLAQSVVIDIAPVRLALDGHNHVRLLGFKVRIHAATPAIPDYFNEIHQVPFLIDERTRNVTLISAGGTVERHLRRLIILGLSHVAITQTNRLHPIW